MWDNLLLKLWAAKPPTHCYPLPLQPFDKAIKDNFYHYKAIVKFQSGL